MVQLDQQCQDFVCLLLGFKHRVLCMLDKHSTTELHIQTTEQI